MEHKQLEVLLTKPVQNPKKIIGKENSKPILNIEDEMLKKQKQEEKALAKMLKIEEKELAKKLKLEEKELAKKLKLEEKELAKQQRIEENELTKKQKLEEKRIAKQQQEEIAKRKLEEKQKLLEEKKLAEEKEKLRKKNKALNGIKYLLNISDKYSIFYEEKLKSDLNRNVQRSSQYMDEAAAVIEDEDETGEKKINNLKYFEGGTLRQYQIEGVEWLITLFNNGLNGILADEMGLGKTIQVIALISYLMEMKTDGPYLIIAPLSTIPNWESEFKRFAPQIPVVAFHGSKEERSIRYKLMLKKYNIDGLKTFPVVLTTYQVPLREKKVFDNFYWQYIIIDEGHRIKNHNSLLSNTVRSLKSHNRLLLTGTPIQNDITELWSLLNFLMPQIFKNIDTFASLLVLEDMNDDNKLIEDEEKNQVISSLHRVLKPFTMRRLKKDVLTDMVPKEEINIYCPLSPYQRELYEYVINKNLEQLSRKKEILVCDVPRKRRKLNYKECDSDDEKEDDEFIDSLRETVLVKVDKETVKTVETMIVRLTMLSTLSMYRKIVNHPYLVHFPLDPRFEEKTLLIDEQLIQKSGKMVVLDNMLKKLKAQGHKVLIFCTSVMTLDLIEELFIMRKYKCCRLDGGRNIDSRKENIEQFNKDPKIFAFLLSTRAGGLGLNLTAADTVIFFDRDWNPQADIQAQDRCHRIGQTKPVMIFSLIAKGTIDEKIVDTGFNKRKLEKLVIKDGKFLPKTICNKPENFEKELRELKKVLQEESIQYSDMDKLLSGLDKLLDRSKLYALTNQRPKRN